MRGNWNLRPLMVDGLTGVLLLLSDQDVLKNRLSIMKRRRGIELKKGEIERSVVAWDSRVRSLVWRLKKYSCLQLEVGLGNVPEHARATRRTLPSQDSFMSCTYLTIQLLSTNYMYFARGSEVARDRRHLNDLLHTFSVLRRSLPLLGMQLTMQAYAPHMLLRSYVNGCGAYAFVGD